MAEERFDGLHTEEKCNGGAVMVTVHALAEQSARDGSVLCHCQKCPGSPLLRPDADVIFGAAENLTRYRDKNTDSGHVLERYFLQDMWLVSSSNRLFPAAGNGTDAVSCN